MKHKVLETSGRSLLTVSTSFLLLFFPMTVRSQCDRGDEETCVWSNDGASTLRWVPETSSGETYMRVEQCSAPRCGVGTILSPLLPPNGSPNELIFYYKVHGYTSVYLKLYQKKENQNPTNPLFSKVANYGDSFPRDWTMARVIVPATDTNYQLMLKADTPFSGAFVAVRGLVVQDTSMTPRPTTSSSSTTTSTTRTPAVPATSSTTTTTEQNDIDFPEDDGELEDDRNEMTQALEDNNFITVEDLNLGHTTVVYPDICKY